MDVIKITVNIPEEFSDKVREAISKSGAGKIGKYDSCSFSVKGVGRSKPLEGANPAIGTIGKIELINEERIETWCLEEDLSEVIKAIKSAHPYEEPVIITSRVEIY